MPVALIFLPRCAGEKQVLQRKCCGVETAKPRVAAKPRTMVTMVLLGAVEY